MAAQLWSVGLILQMMTMLWLQGPVWLLQREPTFTTRAKNSYHNLMLFNRLYEKIFQVIT